MLPKMDGPFNWTVGSIEYDIRSLIEGTLRANQFTERHHRFQRITNQTGFVESAPYNDDDTAEIFQIFSAVFLDKCFSSVGFKVNFFSNPIERQRWRDQSDSKKDEDSFAMSA